MSTAPKRPLRGWWSDEQTQAAVAARQQAADTAQAGLDPMSNALRMRSAADMAELDGLDANSIRRMSMSSYAEIRRRAGLPERDPFEDAYQDYEPPQAERTVSAPEAVQANAEPQGIDIASMDMNTYAQLRSQLGVVGREYGRGALDGGSTADWVQAAQRKAGRSAWQGRNVQESPRIDGRFLKQDERDTRSAAQRFSTPGNSWQGR